MDFFEGLDAAMQNLSISGGFLSSKNIDGKINTMTISWGFIGYMWNKPHFIALVRPQRFTDSIMKNADSFTISIPYDKAPPYNPMRKELVVCGSKSGFDIDKSGVVNFIDAKAVSSPVVADCAMYYECKIVYRDALDGNEIPSEINKKFYDNDWHNIYIGEIVETYKGQA